MKLSSKNFGQLLRNERTKRNMKLKDVADLCNTFPSSLSRYENGKQVPTPDVLQRIKTAFDLPNEIVIIQRRRKSKSAETILIDELTKTDNSTKNNIINYDVVTIIGKWNLSFCSGNAISSIYEASLCTDNQDRNELINKAISYLKAELK